MLDSARRSSAFEFPLWRSAAVAVVAYSLAALVVASLTYSAMARTFPEAARDLWSAAMIWVALTGGIYGLVRRWPVSRPGYGRAVLLYGTVVAVASWVVNGAFVALYVVTGASHADDLVDRLHTLSLLNLPFNAAAAIALIAVFHWMMAARERQSSDRGPEMEVKAKAPEPIPVCSGTRRFSVPVDSIERVEAADDYVVLHCRSGSHICSERLYRLEKRLAPAGFIRVHRSMLVNLDRVVAMSGRAQGTLTLELSSGRAVAVSRRRRARVRQALLPGERLVQGPEGRILFEARRKIPE